MQGEGLPAGGEGLPVVAEQRLQPADVVQRAGLPPLVPGGPVQVERLPDVFERLRGIAPLLPQVAQRLPGVRLAQPVTGLHREFEGAAQMLLRLVEPALQEVGPGE